MRHAQIRPKKLARPSTSFVQNRQRNVSDLWSRVFSFPSVICALLIVLAVSTARSRFNDPDMWWHLKIGQIIWQSHAIPRLDTFSYTTNHHGYIAHEWLGELLIYMAYHVAGYSGLMLWLCANTAVVLISSYVLCAAYSGNVQVAFLGALTVWFFGTIGFAVRPQMIGYLFLTIELFLLHKGKTDPRWLCPLPLLFALWVNCHGSFLLGISVGLLFFLTSGLDLKFAFLVASRWNATSRRALGFMLLLSGAALMLNPIGTQLLLYPLDTLFHQSINTGYVREWQPVQLTDPRGLALCAILGSVAFAVIFFRFKLHVHELVLLACGCWLGASHRRFLFMTGILSAPLLTRMLGSYSQSAVRQEPGSLLGAGVLGASFLAAYVAFPSARNLNDQVERISPLHAVEFIKAHSLTGPMLNDWAYGGYLIWAMPEHPVFIDGRADIFEWTGVLKEFVEWSDLNVPPNALPDKYGVKFCLLSRQSSMATAISSLPGWSQVYADDHSVIFVRSNEKGRKQE